MKAFVLSILIVMISLTGMGQNLVPNPSFEENNLNNSCKSLMDSVVAWFNPHGATPDYYTYYNFCIGVSSMNNSNGYQLPKEGVSYAGVYTEGNPTREYIAVALSSPLEQGKNYTLEFYVSLANECKFAVKTIGGYFTSDTSGYKGITTNIPVFPQVENQNVFLSDTTNWMKISGDFEAIGGEKFLIIGNFRDVNNTETEVVNSQSTWESSYYYIDQVSLSINDLGIENHLQNDVKIFPNPFTNQINITTSEMEPIFHLLSISGTDNSYNLTIEKINPETWEINTERLSPGYYILSINHSFFKTLVKY